jgi:hypothetical protein
MCVPRTGVTDARFRHCLAGSPASSRSCRNIKGNGEEGNMTPPS